MSRRLTGTVVVALALAACAAEAPPKPDDGTTDATTRSLLDAGAAAGAGGSTPIPAVGQEEMSQLERRIVPEGERIDIASLGLDYGEDEAPVTVLEMSDFGCTFCRQFHLETWQGLRQDFVVSGKVQWKFVPFVTGMFPNSEEAAEAAECTLEQGRDHFETLSRRLWAEQNTWKSSAAPEPMLRGWAGEAGVELARFDRCMAEDVGLRRVALSTELSHQLGVRGTPTFFVRGFRPIQGALPAQLFQQLLSTAHEMALEAARENG